MKKMAWLMVIALAVALAATACGGGGGDDDNGGNPFVGTWMDRSNSNYYYTFKADLSYSRAYPYLVVHSYGIATSSGTYTYSGNTAKLDIGMTLTIEHDTAFYTDGEYYYKQ